jgi:hypothetical protein
MAAIISLVVYFVMFLAIDFLSYIGGNIDIKASVVRLLICAGIIIGLSNRNRIVWNLSLFYVALTGLGVIAAVVIPMATNKQVNLILMAVLFVFAVAPLAITFVALLRNSAKQYMGFICPSCGSKNVKAKNFSQSQMICKDCANIWI